MSGLRLLLLTVALGGCGDVADVPSGPVSPYAQQVVSYQPGAGAGHGQDKLPGVVLGPPDGKGERAASLQVLSLGVGGEIVLGFGELAIIDGPGPDLIVFENPFWAMGDPEQVFVELGEVAVSEDGEVWHTFPCDTTAASPGRWPGCAGWTPTLRYDAALMSPLDPQRTGGDAFDLAELGIARARFVRVRDMAMQGAGPSAGFDLDAVGLVHYEVAP